jgi:3-methyladenine DNA glycosylase AlkD
LIAPTDRKPFGACQRRTLGNRPDNELADASGQQPTVSAKEIHARLERLANKKRAKFLQKFFRTGAGQYGEGDIFLGVRVPVLRRLAREYEVLSTRETLALLRSPIHEARLLSLFLFLRSFTKADEAGRRRIYDVYLKNAKYINSWDLVDVSAPSIVGAFLIDKSKTPLYALAKSSNLWERRISIMATAYFIRRHRFSEALKVAKLLVSDKHDLVHKAVGWMLREIGKRDREVEEKFLRSHYKSMPRTMLRYAIEHFPKAQRVKYLKATQ